MLNREKGEKKKKKGKKYREKKTYILTPRPCPNQGVLGPAGVVLVDQSDRS